MKSIELSYTNPQIDIFFNIPKGVKYQIVTKGRRFGATRGAAHACIEYCLEGEKILWGDTINSNIDRYYERYFLPALKATHLNFEYKKQQKQLYIENGYIDFRSADNPENWEGFGYNKIFLNEAGIILKNKYLYTNAVLPMLMDYPDSVLIAAGVPKGKMLKTNEQHPFYTLYQAAKNGVNGYHVLEYSSYDNPLLSKDDIKELENEISRMNPAMVDQEIYGKFVDGVSGTLWSPEMIIHTKTVPQLKRIVVGIDPSGSKDGDEVGIITAGIDIHNNIYILSDKTKGYSPLEWATIAINEFKTYNADAIVVERNFGGDMVKHTLFNVDNFIRIKEVTASKGKEVRAEPVVGLYEQNRIYHVHGLNALENEMITWVPGVTKKSPNRIDALVWAVTDLTKNNNQFVI